MKRHLALAVLGGLALLGGSASAQEAVPTRLRGTLDAVSAGRLEMTTRAGTHASVALPEAARVIQVVVAQPEDIQPGSYVGAAAVPQDDGTLKAIEIVVFPPAMRGAGEGHRPWDLGASSTMTNGTVGSLATTQGRTMTVTYPEGEQHIVVPDGVPIVSLADGERGMLTPGASIIVNGTKTVDGSVTAAAVLVGKDGLVPPM